MKPSFQTVSFLLCLFIFTGCKTTISTDTPISVAHITNMQVEEIGEAFTDHHKLKINFDYVIDDFNPDSNMYTCIVLFEKTDGSLQTTMRRHYHCSIDETTGHIETTWSTPLQESDTYTEEDLRQFPLPLNAYLVIRQMDKPFGEGFIAWSEAILIDP